MSVRERPDSVAPRLWRACLGITLAACLLESAWAQQGDPINIGDVVYVEVFRRPELSVTTQVDQNGNIPVAYVGNVNIGGVTEDEATARVAAALQSILKNPRVKVSRGAMAGPVAGARAVDMKTQIIALNNANAEALCKTLNGMTSQGGSVGFDQNTNSLIVTDTPVTIQNIMGVIAQLDQMQSQVTQVRIEAKVAEVEQGAMKELGVRWFFKGTESTGGYYPQQGQLPGLSSNAGSSDSLANERIGSGNGYSQSGGSSGDRRFVDEPQFDRRLNVPVQVPVLGQMFYGFLNNNVDVGVMLDALVKDKKAQLLATPMILAVNHKPAEIKMTDEWPYTESSQTWGGTNYTVKFMDMGIKLMVTPHVYKDTGGPYVQMELQPEVSFSVGMSNGVPVRSVRSSSSTANVRDGQTLVIGGITLDDEHNVVQKMPVLGDVPLVGMLFKRKERSLSRNELMVFVTPSIHEQPETITWDRMINLTGAVKDAWDAIPSNAALVETRKE